jgi:hypothetical protein
MTNTINTFAHILATHVGTPEADDANLAAETAAAIAAIPERLEAGDVFVEPPKNLEDIIMTEGTANLPILEDALNTMLSPTGPKKRKTLSFAPVLTDEEKAEAVSEASAEAKPAKGKREKAPKAEKPAKPAKVKAEKAPKEPKPAKEPKAPKVKAEKPAKEPRPTKTQDLIELLQATDGATGKDVQELFGWLAHTARGAISTLHRKPGFPKGHKVERTQEEGRGSVYRIVAVKTEGEG